ncbi:helix-turn-helix transcriptional regulator [Streptomyces cavernae]|uniref:helix-turn-helix transcriptional regulator n=1 Tax=Streptomyces cavernae TaxID=2259034 RepID=UPI000FEBC42F|nr:LuxR C-terminal-related transcriptional regulator [Streptomyces cavernae]
MAPESHPHGVEELCEAGANLYARALDEGRVPHEDADTTPCLIDFGLLQRDAGDDRWLLPTAPSVALPRLLRASERQVAAERDRQVKLAAVFEPLMALHTAGDSAVSSSAITVLEGFPRIDAVLDSVIAECREEILTVQPGGKRSEEVLNQALSREQPVVARGVRMRTLYQHTARHSLPVLGHFEHLQGDVEVRTLDEVTERLIVVDREVAFIPGSKDRSVALELRHPGLVDYLVTTFERLWSLGTPMYPYAAPQPVKNGLTTRQRAVAQLLIQGCNDAVIAERLGMNVRTVRVHIAKLADLLGSESRAQLGYLIAESGILKHEGTGG